MVEDYFKSNFLDYQVKYLLSLKVLDYRKCNLLPIIFGILMKNTENGFMYNLSLCPLKPL